VRIWSLLWKRRNGDIHLLLVFGGISVVVCGIYLISEGYGSDILSFEGLFGVWINGWNDV
jgi:hypothetical protein